MQTGGRSLPQPQDQQQYQQWSSMDEQQQAGQDRWQATYDGRQVGLCSRPLWSGCSSVHVAASQGAVGQHVADSLCRGLLAIVHCYLCRMTDMQRKRTDIQMTTCTACQKVGNREQTSAAALGTMSQAASAVLATATSAGPLAAGKSAVGAVALITMQLRTGDCVCVRLYLSSIATRGFL
jgi:hypothetical protein